MGSLCSADVALVQSGQSGGPVPVGLVAVGLEPWTENLGPRTKVKDHRPRSYGRDIKSNSSPNRDLQLQVP